MEITVPPMVVFLFLFLLGLPAGWLLSGWIRRRRNPRRIGVRLPPGPPPEQMTAIVTDGWLTFVGMAAAPTDRFELLGAHPPQGYTGDIVVTIKERSSDQPAETLCMRPGTLEESAMGLALRYTVDKAVREAQSLLPAVKKQAGADGKLLTRKELEQALGESKDDADVKRVLSSCTALAMLTSIGAEHELSVSPPNAKLVGKIV